jgi:hypothetical protein
MVRANFSTWCGVGAMNSRRGNVWVAFGFCAILSVITMIGNIVGEFIGGGSMLGMSAFVCFLPMAFLFAADSQKKEREQIQALEARIRELESAKAVE